VRATLQEKWDEVKDLITFVEGQFQGDKLALLDYMSQLARIAQVYADIRDVEGVRRVALHASDFIEMQMRDSMMAAAVWSIRARLFVAAHRVGAGRARELIEAELRRCLDRERELFEQLDVGRRNVALSTFVVDVWYEAARDVLGREGYAHLVEIVGDSYESLEPRDKMRYAVALGQSGDPAHGTQLMDAVVTRLVEENPGVKISLSSDIECARATIRFRAECRDWSACRARFGPFAHYIYAEVRSWDEDVFADVPEEPPVSLRSQSIQAFVDENLVVMDSAVARGVSSAAATLHEAEHCLFRLGQYLKAEDGRWLQVRRDVPTASAKTYLHLLEHQGDVQAAPLDPAIVELVDFGRHWAQNNPPRVSRQIENMLRYFDDLVTQETPASYPCAAILIAANRWAR
jgi:GNAT superfamily N-acetyltransferase